LRLARQRSGRCGDPLPLAQAGERKVDDKPQPAKEGLIQGALQVGGQDGQAPVGFHALQQVVDLDVGVAVVAVDFTAFAEQGVGFVEENRPSIFSRIEQAPQFFSVSPMYLLTTADRSIRYRLSCNSFAMTSAAIVFPVPLSPANKALMPRPRFIFRRNLTS
jgi:hypothetical protein